MLLAAHQCRGVAISLLLGALLSSPATATDDIVGPGSVLDGDTIEVHGVRIRLEGVDAPETGQLCQEGGKSWHCGLQATLALAEKIEGRTLACRPVGTDRYGRTLAVCFIGREDLNAWLVAEGWALAYRAYSSAYVGDESIAQREHRGIWRGDFVPPWEWRARQRSLQR